MSGSHATAIRPAGVTTGESLWCARPAAQAGGWAVGERWASAARRGGSSSWCGGALEGIEYLRWGKALRTNSGRLCQ